MDRHDYETRDLSVAKHPTETDERLMVRLLAFSLNALKPLEMAKDLLPKHKHIITRGFSDNLM